MGRFTKKFSQYFKDFSLNVTNIKVRSGKLIVIVVQKNDGDKRAPLAGFFWQQTIQKPLIKVMTKT